MTAKKDLKKRIRNRQAKTGESYTTARSHVLRARGDDTQGDQSSVSRIVGVVIRTSTTSLRIRLSDSEETLTLRISSWETFQVVPGQLVEVELSKEWRWRDNRYATGTIKKKWTDVPAIGLEPLPLKDHGIYNLAEIHESFEKPDPYAEMWKFFASVPRRAYEFDGIAWGVGVGVDPDDPEACLMSESNDLVDHDPAGAIDLLVKAMDADFRCIDAHAHLGNRYFDSRTERALKHYEVAIGIGELSLGPEFNGMLPWGRTYNRPFLRALHGYGLCLWRLDRAEEARRVFERILSLNPPDNQGVRFCWNDIRNGRQWVAEDDNDLDGRSVLAL